MNIAKMPITDRNIKVAITRGRGGLRRRAYRVRAENAIGRTLKATEEIHHHSEQHIVICEDHAYHGLLHSRTRVVRAGGNPDHQAICGRCRSVLDLSEFSPN